jgi:hypothetical protein
MLKNDYYVLAKWRFDTEMALCYSGAVQKKEVPTRFGKIISMPNNAYSNIYSNIQ